MRFMVLNFYVFFRLKIHFSMILGNTPKLLRYRCFILTRLSSLLWFRVKTGHGYWRILALLLASWNTCPTFFWFSLKRIYILAETSWFERRLEKVFEQIVKRYFNFSENLTAETIDKNVLDEFLYPNKYHICMQSTPIYQC